jgi:hypothetical protein
MFLKLFKIQPRLPRFAQNSEEIPHAAKLSSQQQGFKAFGSITSELKWR